MLATCRTSKLAATGKHSMTIIAKGVTLGSGPNSLFHDGGTALVIHEKSGRLQDRSQREYRQPDRLVA